MDTQARISVCLSISGIDLIPEEVTAVVGQACTSSFRTGDIRQLISGRETVSKFGAWQLEKEYQEPGDINSQITSLLASLTPDLVVWKRLSEQFAIDLFYAVFMDTGNIEYSLNPATLAALADRNIVISFDIHAP